MISAIFRLLLCRRNLHRARLFWSVDGSTVFCVDCPAEVKTGGQTSNWKRPQDPLHSDQASSEL